MSKYKSLILICLAIFIVTALVEFSMGRLVFGPDGRFGFWASDIWSSENSQRFFDPYSITHILHGFLFYFFLWVFARRLPVKHRLIAAVILEAAWEVLENSPFIINRYRAVTISYGYEGDSILNSLSDIVMMAVGFFIAWKVKVWQSVVFIILMELILLWWVRDNLTLNIIMLIYPIETIKDWQSAGQPLLKLK